MEESTNHKIIFKNANNIKEIKDNSIALVVTSPPYPMINMWNESFNSQNNNIGEKLNSNLGMQAFELMHKKLDEIWDEVSRVLLPNGIVCINIGDATQTIGENFQLYSNHSRILNYFINKGFLVLPSIIWRKATNAPNKFMGSGTLPPGAYVTLEHEYILILRKGGKRLFLSEKEKENRRKSSYFWEERNNWFSDLWEIKGTKQKNKNKDSRERTGAYPFEIAYRLINMFSVKGDFILDPFLGTGTTSLAAIASERNSIGIELDESLKETIIENILSAKETLNQQIDLRIQNHLLFIDKTIKEGKNVAYFNKTHNFKIKTRQETEIKLNTITEILYKDENTFEIKYMFKGRED